MSEGKIRIAEVKPAGDYALRVQFEPERVMTVNLREPVFRLKGLRALRNPTQFARAQVGEGGHSLAWPGDLDMGATRIFEIALEQSGRADAVEFIRWRWRNGLSLSTAADALGLSRRQVAYYASGEHEVPRTVLLACKGWEARSRIPPEELEKMQQRFAQERLQESKRQLESDEFTIELIRTRDESGEFTPEFQQELRSLAESLRGAGVSFYQPVKVNDSVDAQGGPLPEFVAAIRQFSPPIITAVATYLAAWVHARLGRKVRIRIGEIEAEGRTPEELKALLRMVAEFQDERRAEARCSEPAGR
jgi:AraC-like DNA-binding protein